MKLFRPTANWDVRRSDSWWPKVGTVETPTGIRIGPESATSLTAVLSAIRVISETMASLPLAIMRQVDAKTQEKAVDHPLWRVLHDVPTPEQDIVSWMDMQVSMQVGWGNAYAEIERRAGEVYALWPIHSSRIPLCNITRNPIDPPGWRTIVAGQPGEIVFWVNNDDGTKTPIPSSDMLHVPGVLSRNGVTGQSVVMLGAQGIGIAQATEEHTSAFFRNGAVQNIALVTERNVGKETAERLREQWQRVFGGVKNHYKTMILEDGMKPHEFSFSPEAAQLIDARKFNVLEVARIFRLPPHMLADLDRAIQSNIESQSINFVVYSMLPWIVRWEKAMYRQLLTDEEQRQYRFKFNVMGLLRGDSAARSQLYDRLFNMAAASPNDIREMEDMNPIDGGDQYFIPANNLVPLDKIRERVDAEIEQMKTPEPAPPPETSEEDPEMVAMKAILAEQEGKIKAIEERPEPPSYEEPLCEIRRMLGELQSPVDSTQDDPILERLEGQLRALGESLESQRSEIDELRSMRSPEQPDLVDRIQEMLTESLSTMRETPVDTSQAEELAVREAAVESRRQEVEASLQSVYMTGREVLTLALKRDIDKLAEWEKKWLLKASEEPLKWTEARSAYYQRFVKYFVANLEEYIPRAESFGIVLDLQWGADRYAKQSIDDLKKCDSVAADNYHDKLDVMAKELVHNLWTDRPQALAEEMIERGERLYQERECRNEQAD